MVRQMNNSTIKNKMVTVPKGIKLNDEDCLNSVLSSFKEMSKNYSIVLTEASNEALYKTLKKQGFTDEEILASVIAEEIENAKSKPPFT